MSFKKVDPKVSFPKLEEETLKYWEEQKIFEQSVKNREGKPKYSFNDGPPFATGTPHYGHIVGSIMKDAVPRYWTMKGFQVERKWGWDCHGLPIENIAEKELGIKHKKDIEEMGVAKFNEFCRSKVLEYAAEWEKVMPRIGRWADMENAYRTMDKEYMESVWWVFKELWDKGLIYESYRSMHVCPRCETTLSQQEVSEGYADVKDLSVVAKFELVDEPGTYVLAWTTTPWTLPGNVALAVGKDISYKKIKLDDGVYIVAKDRVYDLLKKHFGESDVFDGVEISTIKGADLVGKSYKPLFDYYAKDTTLPNHENGWKIYAADFVTTEDGTGVVHIAPAFGEDDMNLGKEKNLPFVQHVNLDGTMKGEVTDFAGQPVKPKEAPQSMDIEIIKYLAHKELLFSKEKYEHSYPHCWRCDTPLLNYATSSWFVAVTKIKEQALELAKDIRWSPEYIKEGRFGKWLEGARDWSISRQRYWASVMPIWKCECGELSVFGSIADLEAASGQKVEDLHKHIVDGITIPCAKCGGTMKRIPDVLDTWFDSGSMPYAQEHYPFANQEHFEKSFPADFIAEGVDQTRAWFYYQHVIGTAIKEKAAFKNVIVNGIVLAEDGKKMSKKLKNYPDPMEIVNKHGADALRFYLLSSPIVSAENLNFSERDLTEVSRNVFRMLWNSYSFFTMYASIDAWEPKKDALPSKNLLDRWILSELQVLIRDIDQSMGAYELAKATRLFMPFIDNLSNWYIRRNRKRFWKNENDGDKEDAYQTLYDVLVTLSKLMAPFTPFLSEEIYRNLTGGESVHLSDWPLIRGLAYEIEEATEKEMDEGIASVKISTQMQFFRQAITEGLQLRSNLKIKVRQPLQKISIGSGYLVLGIDDGDFEEFQSIIKDELNVKEVKFVFDEDKAKLVELDTNITEDLRLEGEMNEINRAIQEGRKKAGFNVEDRIVLGYQGKETVFEKFGEVIMKEVLASEKPMNGDLTDAEYRETVTIEGEDFSFSLRRA